MKIAIDWDDTFTRDLAMWARFIHLALGCGHEVRIVTYRDPETIQDIFFVLDELDTRVPVVATGAVQKRTHCNNIGWMPDVWIDDSPEFIVEDYYKPGMMLAQTVKDIE